jgi:ribosomal protein S18 acetylase RimI-like enzyme
MLIEPPHPNDIEQIIRTATSTQVFAADDLGVIQEMFFGFFNSSSYYDHSFLVCRTEDTRSIIGFAVYGPTAMAERVWDLYWICVDRSVQGNGVGLALLQRLEKDVRMHCARALYLETSDAEAYKPARDFYERNGFQLAAHLSDYYAPGEGMMIYRKIFTP